MSSSHQVSSSSTHQVVNKSYEMKQYKYEQQTGGTTQFSQMKPFAVQQEYSVQEQQNQSFKGFEIPIKKPQVESQQTYNQFNKTEDQFHSETPTQPNQANPVVMQQERLLQQQNQGFKSFQIPIKKPHLQTQQTQDQFTKTQSQFCSGGPSQIPGVKPFQVQPDYVTQDQQKQEFKGFQIPVQKTQVESQHTSNQNFEKTQHQFQSPKQFQSPSQEQFQGPFTASHPQGQFHGAQDQGKFRSVQPQGQFQGGQSQTPFQNTQFQGESQSAQLQRQLSGVQQEQVPFIEPNRQFQTGYPQKTFQGVQQGQFEGTGHQGQLSGVQQGQFQGGQPQGQMSNANIQDYSTGKNPQEQFQGTQPLAQFQKEPFQNNQQFQNQFQAGKPPAQTQTSLPRNQQNYHEDDLMKEWPPKNQSGPNQTTTYPSGFKLREEAPMEHISDVQVVPSQPAFKITQPMRVKADEKWPPREGHMDITSEQVREFTKPKKANRDYSEFFQQNALPNTYPSYRAPPGTQHRTLGEQ